MYDKKSVVLTTIDGLWTAYTGKDFKYKQSSSNNPLHFTVTKDGVVYGDFDAINTSNWSAEDYITSLCHELGHMIYNKFVKDINKPKLRLTKREKFERLVLEICCDIFAVRAVSSILGMMYSIEFVKTGDNPDKNYFNVGYPTANERVFFMRKCNLCSNDIVSLGMKYIPKELDLYYKGDKDSIMFIDGIIRNFC